MISVRILATIAIAFGTLAAGGFFFANNASADSSNPRESIIERIASRFNLNKDDVKSVFDEDRKEREEEMEKRFEERLSQAVKDGKITEDQKSLILAKHEELRKERGSDFKDRKNMTPEERRSEAEKHRSEMEAWAKTNNIPDEFVGPSFNGRMGGPGGLGMGMPKESK